MSQHRSVIVILVTHVLWAITSAAAWAQEPEATSPLEEILRRLNAAEQQVDALHDQLNDARNDVSSLRDQLNALKEHAEEQAEKKPAGANVVPPIGPPSLDPQLVESGMKAFQDRCTQCHDPSRPLQKQKSLKAWEATVRRMARKRSADIAPEQLQPIAAYLASVAGPQMPLAAPPVGALPETAPTTIFGGQLDLNATISTVWRGSTREQTLENEGFFPDVWLGAEWHSSGPFSGRVLGCVTCHTEGQKGNRIELVESVVRFDVHKWLGMEAGPQASLEAGRFVVPFGSMGAKSHPGAQRTVTKSLLFNMGQNVNRDKLGPAVLPMPYSDEGVLAHASVPLFDNANATIDAYVVNGLQGSTSGIDFFDSRDYVDNNSEPAFGGRLTAGNQTVRLGGSFMTGQFNDDAGPVELDYEIFGVDLTIRHEDLLRFLAEYAVRVSDRFPFIPDKIVDDEIEGFAVEGELRLLKKPRLSVVARYDMLERHADPSGSSFSDSDFDVDRFTWGFNVTLPGGSHLLINHEHWMMPDDFDDVDVIGVRWVGSFSN